MRCIQLMIVDCAVNKQLDKNTDIMEHIFVIGSVH